MSPLLHVLLFYNITDLPLFPPQHLNFTFRYRDSSSVVTQLSPFVSVITSRYQPAGHMTARWGWEWSVPRFHLKWVRQRQLMVKEDGQTEAGDADVKRWTESRGRTFSFRSESHPTQSKRPWATVRASEVIGEGLDRFRFYFRNGFLGFKYRLIAAGFYWNGKSKGSL